MARHRPGARLPLTTGAGRRRRMTLCRLGPMAMKCNLEARGRRLRLITGIACGLAGVVFGLLALVAGLAFGWFLLGGIGLLAAGVFQVFEARKGWCIVRAMGIKTPL